MRKLIPLLLLASLQAFAANHYVLTGASGTGAGTDWTNACTDFSGSCAVASLVRGDTYYVGTGTYAGRTFNTSDSGSSVITIKGATVADHGTATGWSSAFSVSSADGGSQAVWSSTLTWQSDYWVWDGAVGPGTSVNPADTTPGHYGFSYSSGLSRAQTIGTAGSSGVCGSANHDITFKHFYALATSSDVEKEFEEGNTYGGVLTNITWSHFLVDGWQGLFMTKSGACSGTAETGLVVEYGVMLNGSSTSANHGEWINPNERPISGTIIRYSIFRANSGGAGETGVIVANNSGNTSPLIYGNVFDDNLVGNGIITGTSAGNLNTASIYNNTFLNMPGASGNALCGSGQGTGNIAQNNLFYNMKAAVSSGCTTDYDTFNSTTSTPSETNGQIRSGNPFTNSASFDYSITADTNAGNTLSGPAGCTEPINCYDDDALGTVRGSNGVWDRGALQIPGSTPPIAPAPSLGMFAEVRPK